MSQTILILSTSPRKGGNSDTLANEFLKGAKDVGHRVEKVCLSDKTIRFCKGCLACNQTHRCVIHDDADKIYYYEMCGQMKTMLDRANPLYGSDYRFRDIYLLSTAAEDGGDVPRRAENGLQGWIDCFPKARLTGTVFAGGVDTPGSIQGHPALKKAYEMGRAVSARKE